MSQLLLVAPPAVGVKRGYLRERRPRPYFDSYRIRLDPDGMASYPAENLAIMSLKSSAAAEGITVSTINSQTAQHRGVDQTWEAIKEAASRLEPAVVGFTGTPELFEENSILAEWVKEKWPSAVTVLGHDLATLNWRRLLRDHHEFDVACRGEGERTLIDVFRAAVDDRDLSSVCGIALRDAAGEPCLTGAREPLDLDMLPWPARDDLLPVLRMGMSASVFSSRGCTFRCTYCTTGATANTLRGRASYRTKSVANVVDEIEMLVRDFGIEHVTITDDLFVTRSPDSRERAVEFANEMRRRRLGIRFMIDCRIDSIEQDVFKQLRDAGLHRVFVGVETTSDERLRAYRKVYDGHARSQIDVIRRSLHILDDLGVEVIPGILTYHAFTTREELHQLLKLVDLPGLRVRSGIPFSYRVQAYAGTPLHAQYKEAGLLIEDWPIGKWRFADAAADRHYQRVALEVQRNRWSYQAVKAEFEAALAEWDRAEEAIPGPS